MDFENTVSIHVKVHSWPLQRGKEKTYVGIIGVMDEIGHFYLKVSAKSMDKGFVVFMETPNPLVR